MEKRGGFSSLARAPETDGTLTQKIEKEGNEFGFRRTAGRSDTRNLNKLCANTCNVFFEML